MKDKGKKRILFIHHAVGWGGAPINMLNIINSLDKSKYDIEVLLLKDSVVSEKFIGHNIKVKIARSSFYKKYYKYFTHSEAGHVKWFQVYKLIYLSILWMLSHYYFAERELKEFNYDIIHLNSSVLTDWLAPAKKMGKVIMHVQEPLRKGNYDCLFFFFNLQMKKHADIIIAISNDNANRINIPEKTKVIYNYASIPDLPPNVKTYHSKKVLYLGGAAYIKGFYTLVDSLKYLDEDIIVYFGGNYSTQHTAGLKGFLKKILNKVSEKRRKREKALKTFRGSKHAIEIGLTSNVDKYLDEACCLISPFSKPHFSRPIIESHLHRKPVIGSDVQGMDEVVSHNINGIIVPVNNPLKLAEAINYLCNNPILAQKMGEAGFAKAIKSYSPKNVEEFIKIYESFYKLVGIESC